MADHEMNSISPDQLRCPDHVLLNNSSPTESAEHMNRRHSRVFVLAGFIAFFGVGCLLAGVVLISLSQREKSLAEKKTGLGSLNQTKSCNNDSSSSKNESKQVDPCEFSLEAKRVGKPI